MRRTLRTTAKKAETSDARRLFKETLDALVANETVKTFDAFEPRFLNTMSQFDRMVEAGDSKPGDRNNGKGDFLNDALAVLLERRSGVALRRRTKVPGLLFDNHSLDATYPDRGLAEWVVEMKALGCPKHPGSEKQKVSGRDGSADLEKRIKEAAFKDVDIKGEYERVKGESDDQAAGLSDWLHRTSPRSWLLLSVRVTSETDLRRVLRLADAASDWFTGCGVYAFGHVGWDLTAPYESKPVPATLRLDTALYRAATTLRGVAKEGAAG